jgi:hypothetical protein
VGNLSYNLVGEEYLRPAIYELSSQSGVNFFSPFYTPITTPMAMNIAGNVSTFDLENFSTNFTSWSKHFDENSFTTSWNLPTRTILDLRAQIIAANATDTTSGTAYYSYADAMATISIPGHGVIVDHSVIYEDSSSSYSIIMLAIIITLIALTIISSYVGKHLLKTKRTS